MGVFFSDKLQRILFIVILLITIIFLLYPKYLPMTDLPQHIALVVSFDDFLKDKGVWSSMLWINWDTNYILLYLYWLLLYQILPILWATKIVVISIFLLYIYAIRSLRRTFQADRMLDWVGLTCFFGYSFQYGFISFILGVAFGLLFLSFNKRYLDNPSKKDWWLILLTGVLTYYSHLLAFAFFCMTAYAYFIFSSIKMSSWQQRIKFTVPYLVFALLLLHYLTMPNPVPSTWWYDGETAWSVDKSFNITLWQIKKIQLFYLPWDMNYLNDFLGIFVQLLLLSPFFIASITKKKTYYIIFILALITYFIMPRKWMESFYLYHRFAWIVVIFYFLLWEKNQKQLKGYRLNVAQIASVFFIIAIVSLMFRVYVNHINFTHSPSIRDMEIIEQQMQPEKKVLYLFEHLYNPYGENITPSNFYEHLASYYQAKKHGWRDKNFASEVAIPVRFTKEANYSKDFRKNIQFSPDALRHKLDCTPYDYLIIRSSFNAKTLNTLFKDNPRCVNMQVIVETKSLILLGKNEQ